MKLMKSIFNMSVSVCIVVSFYILVRCDEQWEIGCNGSGLAVVWSQHRPVQTMGTTFLSRHGRKRTMVSGDIQWRLSLQEYMHRRKSRYLCFAFAFPQVS